MDITREESSAMRGIGILCIVLHNYIHWLGPMVKENEYTFNWHNVTRLLAELGNPDIDLMAHLLSFFGHYGVPVFVALSAYGLVKKYEQGGTECGVGHFVWTHYKKLFLMMAVGYTAFVMVDYMTPAPRHYTFWNVVGGLGMFSNLYADPDKAIWPGPYWYFGLMVQLYIVYRLALYRGRNSLSSLGGDTWAVPVSMALCMATLFAQYTFDPDGDALNWYRYNVFGALPVFIMALYAARTTRDIPHGRGWNLMMAVVSTAAVLLMSLSFWSWVFAPFAVCVATFCLVRALPAFLLRPLSWVGSISAAMFVCHPIARKVIIPISRRGDVYAGLLLYIVATIFLSILFDRMIKSLNRK